jgi:hypothetical protein
MSTTISQKNAAGRVAVGLAGRKYITVDFLDTGDKMLNKMYNFLP